MTIAKATRFQSDLRQLFEKYGIDSGFAFFVHDNTCHPIEAHVTEANPYIVELLDGLTHVFKEYGLPVYTHISPNDDN